MIALSQKTVVIMVGLPARGKSFFSSKLGQYLGWLGHRARVFNAGVYRRNMLGVESARSDFFDPRMRKFREERERIARACFSDLAMWLAAEGDVAIYDATNVTALRREYLIAECARHGFDLLFVEVRCDDTALLARIVEEKVAYSPDYAGVDAGAAKEDFLRRVAHYESIYEPLNKNTPHITLYDLGARSEKIFLRENDFFDEVFSYLKHLRGIKKSVYLARHGETQFNLEDRIGGDASLSEKGKEMARALAKYFAKEDIFIFTSDKKRTKETAAFFAQPSVPLAALDEIRSGICDSMTYEDIAHTHPDIEEGRKKDKFNFRYPEGESYHDLIWRVREAVWAIESQQKDTLVIAHRAVNRCLYSYFIPTMSVQIPYIDMPLGKIMRIRPHEHPHCKVEEVYF